MRAHILTSGVCEGERTYTLLRCDRCDDGGCALHLQSYRSRSKCVTRNVMADAVPTELPVVAYTFERAPEGAGKFRAVDAHVPNDGFTVANLAVCLQAVCEESRRASCSQNQVNQIAQVAPRSQTQVSAKTVAEARRKMAQWRQDRFAQTMRRGIEICAVSMWMYRTSHATPTALIRFAVRHGTSAVLWWLVYKYWKATRAWRAAARISAEREASSPAADASVTGLEKAFLSLCIDNPICIRHARVCALPKSITLEARFEMCEPDVEDCSAILTSGRVVVECAAAPRTDGAILRLGHADSYGALRSGAWMRSELLGMDCRVSRVHSLRSFATGLQNATVGGSSEPCIAMLEVLWRGRNSIWNATPTESVEDDPATWLCLALRTNCARVTIYPCDSGSTDTRVACERLLLEARTELEYVRVAVLAS
ncbi:hypothetical protein CYMTET_44188 [Cymbomonas tetramitiformis]|uniref:Uncharacterized protein n=1 Tax=Cymbomonas tetramitiformis TaxID=36881 RepID=A0AAE0C1W5_9CHLO|nr:hypothetical protein CYMTET_44192 [Cymbomonas tetramitiformis]KAK3246269.1 hypothetical protein CYMTET_44188 [Cymbomonas tetramitiformis]